MSARDQWGEGPSRPHWDRRQDSDAVRTVSCAQPGNGRRASAELTIEPDAVIGIGRPTVLVHKALEEDLHYTLRPLGCVEQHRGTLRSSWRVSRAFQVNFCM